jgi:hypothetical protein
LKSARTAVHATAELVDDDPQAAIDPQYDHTISIGRADHWLLILLRRLRCLQLTSHIVVSARATTMLLVAVMARTDDHAVDQMTRFQSEAVEQLADDLRTKCGKLLIRRVFARNGLAGCAS